MDEIAIFCVKEEKMRSFFENRKIFSNLSVVLALGLMTAVVVAGCGGGDSASSLAMVEYTGLTTPAVLTVSNAEEITLDAYEGGSASGGIGGISIGAVSSQENVVPAVLKLNDLLEDVVDPTDMTENIFAGLTDSVAMTGCSGRSQITGTINETSGAFTMSIAFYSYDADCSGETISGTVSASGTMDLNTYETTGFFETIGTVTMNFYTLTFADATDSISFGGSWTVTSVNADTEQIDFWYVVRDNNSGVSFKFGDPADKAYLLITNSGSTDDILMDGVFYNPDEGWVNFSVDLTIEDFTGLPTSGTVTILDEVGSSAVLTVPSSTSPYDYTITIDIVGSAPFDVDGYWQSS
jgi:hypothetical protein